MQSVESTPAQQGARYATEETLGGNFETFLNDRGTSVKCSYESPFDGFCCPLPAHADSGEPYCILHSADSHKNPDALVRILRQKFEAHDYFFDGCVFTIPVDFRGIEFRGPVSFHDAVFQKGATFAGCKFHGRRTVFSNCSFGGMGVDFSNAEFTGEEVRFEFIILDSPPVLCAADASVTCRHMDGTVLVVRFGVTKRETAQTSAERIRTAGGQVFGFVVNDLPPRQSHSYSQYAYGGAENYRRV